MIVITIRGKFGEAIARFETQEWLDMNALDRVLAIHKRCRAVTGGQPFDVIRESRTDD